MNLWEIGCLIGFFICIFGNYGLFAQTVLRWSRKPKKGKKGQIHRPKISGGEAALCMIPLVQVCIVRKALYRRNTGTVVLSVISGLLILVRFLNAFVISINSYVMFFTAIGMWVGFFLFLLIYGFVTADCAKMYSFSWFMIILNFFVPMIACWWLKNIIPNKMRAMYKEDTFSEHKSDTVIKSRANK